MTAYLSAHSGARQTTTHEYIVPMTHAMRTIKLFENNRKHPSFPGSSNSTSLRPRMHFSSPCFVRACRNSFDNKSNKSEDGSCQYSPEFPLDVLKVIITTMLKEAVHSVGKNIRDPVGGNIELLLVPLLQLLHTLLLMGVYHHSDLQRVLSLIIPSPYIRENNAGKLMDGDEDNDYDIEQEGKEGRALVEQKTLLQMKLPDAVKLQVCKCSV